MYCIQCNKQLKDGSKFCSFCGTVQSADNGFSAGTDKGFSAGTDKGFSSGADRGFASSVDDSFNWMDDTPSSKKGQSHSFMDESIAESTSPYNVVVKKNLKNNKKSKNSKNSKNKKTESSEIEKKKLGVIIVVLSTLIFIVLIVGIVFMLSQYTDIFDGLGVGGSTVSDTGTADTGKPDANPAGGEGKGQEGNSPEGEAIEGTGQSSTGPSALDDIYDSDRVTDEYGIIGSLNIMAESTNASEDKASKVASDWVQVKRNSVPVYSEANDTSEIIGEVNSGFTAKYYGDESDYAHIKYHGRDGYILKIDTDGASRRQVAKTIETYIRYKDILDLFLSGPENAQYQYNRPWVEFYDVDMGAFEQGRCAFALYDINSDGIEELVMGSNSFNGDMKDNGTPYYVNGYMAGAVLNSHILYEEVNPYNVNKVLSY